jgi:hypothetical protein
MDNSAKEIAAIEKALVECREKSALELHDLQLAAFGGGTGETILV